MSSIVNEGCPAELNAEECASPEGSGVTLRTIEPPTVSETMTAQFASSMETLAKDAVNKICTLASEESAVLRLEVCQSQNENGALKRKLELMEKELRTAQGGGAGERPANTLCVGVQFAGMEEDGPIAVVVKEETVEDCSEPQHICEISEEEPEEHKTDAGEEPPVENRVKERSTQHTGTDSNWNTKDANGDTKENQRASKGGKRLRSTKNTRSLTKRQVLSKAIMAEISKVFDLYSLEISRDENEEKVPNKLLLMAQFSTVMDTLAEEAVNKICTLASEECLGLCLEVSPCQTEIGYLRRKLELMEKELRTAQGGGAGERPSVGVQFADMEEAGPLSAVVKVEKTEDCCDPREGYKVSGEGPAKHSSDCGEEPPVESCVEACAEGSEEQGTRRTATDSNSNIADVTRNTKETRRASKREKRISSWRSSSKRLDPDTLQVGDLEKPFRCTECEKTFATKRSLYKHSVIHTERKYNCLKCGKRFHLRRSLKSHQFVHGAEKPFCCLICGKGFTVRYSLKVHQRIHTGAKPYSCDTCGKSFHQGSSLKKHHSVHTGEKQYACDMKFEDVEEAGPVSVVVKEENIEDCSEQGPAKHSSDCGEEPPVESCVEACAESSEGRGTQPIKPPGGGRSQQMSETGQLVNNLTAAGDHALRFLGGSNSQSAAAGPTKHSSDCGEELPVESCVEACAEGSEEQGTQQIRKVVDLDSVVRGFEIPQDPTEEAVPEKPIFVTQFSAVMDALAEEAVKKICTLASEESAVLRFEVSQSQNEIRALERKVELMEEELRTAQGGGAGERPANTLSVGVQAESEFRAAARVAEEARSRGVQLWGESVLTDVKEQVSLSQCVVVMVEPEDMQEDGLESIVIKEEILEEDLDSSNPQDGLRLGGEGAVELSMCGGEKYQEPVGETALSLRARRDRSLAHTLPSKTNVPRAENTSRRPRTRRALEPERQPARRRKGPVTPQSRAVPERNRPRTQRGSPSPADTAGGASR
ncbi:hypothetical protein AAFF_G00037600 [Aldrovandia affinis]|uniref:C2H2-type domain-containing protein n=1 Tax=Aldrovandia affinis TaxID=143900 RepID=A0AAD7T5V4_9TELE|nr:hypothetical protein AAFF_G00037600 [Aldrovandia affinis]